MRKYKFAFFNLNGSTGNLVEPFKVGPPAGAEKER
jgi:hypothetical protein